MHLYSTFRFGTRIRKCQATRRVLRYCWNPACQSTKISLTETLIDRVGLFRQAADTACQAFHKQKRFFPGAGFLISSVYLSLWTKRDPFAHGNRVWLALLIFPLLVSTGRSIVSIFPCDFSTEFNSTLTLRRQYRFSLTRSVSRDLLFPGL